MEKDRFSHHLQEHLERNWTHLGALEGNLLAAAGSADSATLMVVSAARGEGRTTAAASIGWALSLSGQTLLIDGHVKAPTLGPLFGAPVGPGLTDVVLDGVPLEDALFPVAGRPLVVLPAGRPETTPAVIFRHPRFAKLMQTVKEDWAHVICDTPPFFEEADAAVMARHFDGSVLVLVCEKTRWTVANLISERLEAAGGRLLGAVLNHRKFHVPEAIYRAL